MIINGESFFSKLIGGSLPDNWGIWKWIFGGISWGSIGKSTKSHWEYWEHNGIISPLVI